MPTYGDWVDSVRAAYQGGAPSRAQLLMVIKDGVRAITVRDVESDLALSRSYETRYNEAKVRLAGTRIAPDSADLAQLIVDVKALMPIDADTDAMGPALEHAIEAIRDEFNRLADKFDRFVSEAAVELQRHVPFYRVRRLATFLSTDGTTARGMVSVAQLPEDARIQSVWYGRYYPAIEEGAAFEVDDHVVSNGRVYRVMTAGTLGTGELGDGLVSTDGDEETLGDLSFAFVAAERDIPVRSVEWAARRMLFDGRGGCGSAYAMDTEQSEIWLYPALDDDHRFDLEYLAVASDLADSDTVPFDIVAAKAAAQYVRGMMQHSEQNDVRSATASLAIYQRAIREAVVDCQDREVGPNLQTQPYDWGRRPRLYGSCTEPGTTAYPNDYQQRTNTTGNISLEAAAANSVIDLLVLGSARTTAIALETAGRAAGDHLTVRCQLPETGGIVLEFRNSTEAGTLLLPDSVFPSQQFETDGATTSAVFEFVFDGTAWIYDRWASPA